MIQYQRAGIYLCRGFRRESTERCSPLHVFRCMFFNPIEMFWVRNLREQSGIVHLIARQVGIVSGYSD
jgi:hypothetical protein